MLINLLAWLFTPPKTRRSSGGGNLTVWLLVALAVIVLLS